MVTDVERESSTMRRSSTKARAVYKKFPSCRTSTGWFIEWCCFSRESDIEENLGIGVSIYFKQVKSLICMLFVCTLLSLPSYFLFWSARSHLNPADDFNEFILALSLGSLGEQQSNTSQLDLQLESQRLEMFCETGVIGQPLKFGAAEI